MLMACKWRLALVLSACAFSVSSLRTAKIDDPPSPQAMLQNHYIKFFTTEPAHSECRVTPTQTCSIDGMARNGKHMVYPGGQTRCIYSNTGPFGFMVVPRDRDKLLLHFEGGGACWNQLSTAAKYCYFTGSKARMTSVGYFDETRPENPLGNHTLVYISACSGDLFAGNVTQPYLDSEGKPVVQRGFTNVRAAIAWVKSNLGAQPLSSLVIGGESAGSLGLQVWSHTLLSELNYRKASVIADSYADVFPTGFQGQIFQSWHVCDTGLLSFDADLLSRCKAGQLTVPDVFEKTIAAFPEVDFGSINSKYDQVQMSYYRLTAMTTGRISMLNPANFHRLAAGILARYSKYPNHANFLLSSGWHSYLYTLYHPTESVMSMAFTGGYNGRTRSLMEEWIGHLARHDHAAGRYCELLGPDHLHAKGIMVRADSCINITGSQTVEV